MNQRFLLPRYSKIFLGSIDKARVGQILKFDFQLATIDVCKNRFSRDEIGGFSYHETSPASIFLACKVCQGVDAKSWALESYSQ